MWEGEVPKAEKIAKVLDKIELTDDDFNSERFLPGTSGESALYREFLEQAGLSNLG
jgi:hypothetical protein